MTVAVTDMVSDSGKGWTACLELEYELRQERTVLTRNRHSGPLVVQRPLYPEEDVCHTCILHPPGGVVGGDYLEIDILAKQNSRTLLTTPGATKFYRSKEKKAVQEQRIKVDDAAVLEWFPQDNILFPGADAEISTRVDLAPEAIFMGWEILCLGLPVNRKRFTSGRVQTIFSIHRSGIPLFVDRLRIEKEKDLDRAAGLRGFPVVATFIATHALDNMLQPLRSLASREEKALYGVTLLDDLLVVRYLGFSTFAAQALFTEIWRVLRPEITGREACAPRIWAT